MINSIQGAHFSDVTEIPITDETIATDYELRPGQTVIITNKGKSEVVVISTARLRGMGSEYPNKDT